MGQSVKFKLLLSIFGAAAVAGCSQKVDVSGEKSPDAVDKPVTQSTVKTQKPLQPAFRTAPVGEGTGLK